MKWIPLLVSFHLESNHPAAAEGHHLLYDREAPFELRIQDPNNGPQEVGTLEAIRVKILVLVRPTLTSIFPNIMVK